MDYLLRTIEALAWPCTVLVIVFAFRAELTRLFARLSNIRFKEFEATFEKGLREIEEKRILTSPPKETPTRALETDSLRLSRLAEVSPRAAITEAWIEVEKVASQVADSLGIDQRRRRPVIPAVVEKLIQEQVISPAAVEVFNQLRRLRNEAAHAPEFSLSQREAEKYIDLSLKLANDLWDASIAVELMKHKG